MYSREAMRRRRMTSPTPHATLRPSGRPTGPAGGLSQLRILRPHQRKPRAGWTRPSRQQSFNNIFTRCPLSHSLTPRRALARPPRTAAGGAARAAGPARPARAALCARMAARRGALRLPGGSAACRAGASRRWRGTWPAARTGGGSGCKATAGEAVGGTVGAGPGEAPSLLAAVFRRGRSTVGRRVGATVGRGGGGVPACWLQ